MCGEALRTHQEAMGLQHRGILRLMETLVIGIAEFERFVHGDVERRERVIGTEALVSYETSTD